jgi:hypothetical protein
MTPFEHPDPDWTPRLAWGDHIPLRWGRVSPGVWFVWPPRQFETLEPDGPNIWRYKSGQGLYEPDRPCKAIPLDAEKPNYDSPKIHLMEWGDPIAARWWNHDNGGTTASIGDLTVSVPPSKVRFQMARSFPGHKLDFFYPNFMWEPPTSPPSPWASCRCGPTRAANVADRPWFYPTPEGRRRVAHVWIEPTGVTIDPLENLLPLDLPSEAEVASETQELRKIFSLEESAPLHVRPPSLMLHDLAESTELLELVGDDTFAADFQMFVRHNDFLHTPSGKMVDFSSDNKGAWMLCVLRRYGEIWQDCEIFGEANPENRSLLEQIFQDVGYVVYDPPVAEGARRDLLMSIGATIPRSIVEYILSKPDVAPAIQLAWAMGHFWSEEHGWTEPELPLSSDQYRSLQGGHIPAAADILTMIEAGEIRLGDLGVS